MGRKTSASARRSSVERDAPVSQQLSERIVPERIIYLSGSIDEHSVAQAIAGIVILANQNARAPITLLISTYGGSVDEMFGLYDVVKHVSCPIHTVGIGKVMSAGVLILAAGKKGHRTIGASTRVMLHPIYGGSEGAPFQLRSQLAEAERQQLQMEELLRRETRMTRTQMAQIMKSACDSYLTAREALKLGIADAIIEPKENV